ncbi:MAG TPA: glycogen synthase GlgA [Propylenella sp.]
MIEVLSVASEVYPLVKTGGLADVAGALPGALARHGVRVRTLLPGYKAVLDALDGRDTVHRFAHLQGGPARLLAASAAGLDLLVVDAPHLYVRPGGLYLDQHGRDWPDNAERFAALAQAAAEVAGGLLPGYAPDVLHAHDWQAGLAPAYLYYSDGRRPGTVMTVHNLAFQGIFPADLLPVLGLPAAALSIDGVEYFGGIGFLKAGLQFADRITTVSPTYAAEICTPEAGMGLDGLLRRRSDALSGILNGIDETVWDPSADAHLAARYDAETLDRRLENKRALAKRFSVAFDREAPLFGVVSRLSEQKGLDLLLAALPRLKQEGAQLVVLGAGDAPLEAGYRAAAAAPGRIGVVIGYDEGLAHLIQGGADALLVPSRFEPCGLTQLCAMRYGAIPVAARVGGLNDTIVDANDMALAAGVATGMQFAPVTQAGLDRAIGRTLALWKRPETWRRMQVNGMALPVGWSRPAEQYAELYRGLVGAK